MSAAAIPRVRTLECPNCGGSVTLHSYAHTVNAVCEHCNTVLDATSPSLKILQQYQARDKVQPRIPLGSRGALRGTEYEAIGFQVRQIVVDGIAYKWTEYLLINPYKGFRYLTEYQGHWNFVRALHLIPRDTRSAMRRGVKAEGHTFRHFQHASAATMYVMGEFPWQVRVGDTATVDDFTAPPLSVTSEATGDEVTWSLGEYVQSAEIWKAFRLPGAPPSPIGVYSNQPSPYTGKVASAWSTFFKLLLVLFALMIAMHMLLRGETVFQKNYTYSTAPAGENSFVTPIFEIRGRTAPVEVKVDTDLENDWASFAMALINDETGAVYDFGKEINYYYGRDSDGNWTEGNRSASWTIPNVPAGKYYMRVEPDMDDEQPASLLKTHHVSYNVTVTRGAYGYVWFLFAALLLFIPPIWATVRTFSFESARWRESDYGSPYGISSSSDSGDDD